MKGKLAHTDLDYGKGGVLFSGQKKYTHNPLAKAFGLPLTEAIMPGKVPIKNGSIFLASKKEIRKLQK